MDEVDRIKTALKDVACFAMILVAIFVAPVSGVFGRDAQELAFGFTLALAASISLFSLGLVLLGDWSRARTSIHHHDELSDDSNEHALDLGLDADTENLRLLFEKLKRKEYLCEERFAQRCCSLEDVIRAKADRLRVEIDLIRREKRPKAWAECCAEYHSSK